jgi:hypothetical protein
MFELAREHFPNNAKLEGKIQKLRRRLQGDDAVRQPGRRELGECPPLNDGRPEPAMTNRLEKTAGDPDDGDYHEPSDALEGSECESEDGFRHKSKAKRPRTRRSPAALPGENDPPTPRTKQLLEIINTRDVMQIRLLRSIGAKKAEAIVEALCGFEEESGKCISSLSELGSLKGVGAKTVENMRLGLNASAV